MTKTTVIISSPRNGNSKKLAMQMAEGAKSKGNEVEFYEINKMKDAKGCQGCFGCKKTERCLVKDDIGQLLDSVRTADSIVISTPIYFGQPAAQYRLFEDRLFSFLRPDFSSNIPEGKKVAFAITCGTGISGAREVEARMEGLWANVLKAEVVDRIIAGDMMDMEEASKNAELMAQALAIGKKL